VIAYVFTMDRFARDLLTEVAKAGLPAPLALGALGRDVTLTFNVKLTPAEFATLEAVVAAHDPVETLYARSAREYREENGARG
jgi:hypothetical protein